LFLAVSMWWSEVCYRGEIHAGEQQSSGKTAMQRRDFITLIGGALAASAQFRVRPVQAQQSALPEIGVLNSIDVGPIKDRADAFFEGLEDAHYVVGRNVTVEYRSSEGRIGLLPQLAVELVQRNPAVLVCITSADTVRAAMAATSTIPIVFAISGDPVALGLVRDPAHPDRNVTGAARVTEALNAERLKVLSELLREERPVAFLYNSASAPAAITADRVREMEAEAQRLRRRLMLVDLAARSDIIAVFASMANDNVAGFVISTEALFNVWRDQVIGLSAENKIAAMFPNREYVQSGGLISYGADLYEHYLVAGTYVGRILRGTPVADLPVQIPSKFEMAINLKTARALGLTVPVNMLQNATDLIDD
jgi:putative tryptophan/tyrosine transport system substrate-binding protein